MKRSFLLFLMLLSFSTAFCQNNTEHLSSNQLYLTVNGKQISFSELNDRSIIKLIGKPVNISTKPWETAGTDKVKTYYYKGFNISTVMGSLEFIDITKPGASFSFLIDKKLTQPLTTGSSVELIKRLFPASWAKKDKNGLFVHLVDPKGNIIESYLRFTFTGDTVKTVEFVTDES